MNYRCTVCKIQATEDIYPGWRDTPLWCPICHYLTRWEELPEMKKIRMSDFLESLDKIRELHIKKNEDYATNDNPFSNFEFTEFVLGYFSSNRDKSFVWPIATKLARLAVLLNSNKQPNNESIEDSLLDIATYVLLWKADIARRTLNLPTETKNQPNKPDQQQQD